MSEYNLILGTAGHVDHGKTALIQALTGVNTDRLPEEQRRGITIELGFAELLLPPYRLGIVDVPGHERFVRQMLSGALGMDLAMLVVAADDSVNAQTREHWDILRLLHLPAGVIVVTKCDLVEPAWLDLVEQDIRSLLHGSTWQQAPLVRTSVVSGQGLNELRSVISAAAERVVAQRLSEPAAMPFRLAVDRVFTVAGHGTVVTGSVSSGRVAVGDSLILHPLGELVRVRGLQNHSRVVATVERGQRAAMNLAGVAHSNVTCGSELAAAGYLQPTQAVWAELELLPTSPISLKRRTRLRCHVGTTELWAHVLPLLPTGHEEAAVDEHLWRPGQTGLAQLLFSEPVTVSWRQPLVLRRESPLTTVGGGQVLVPVAERRQADGAAVERHLRELQSADERERALGAIWFLGTQNWEPEDLIRAAGVTAPRELRAELLERGDLIAFALTPQRTLYWHCEVVAAVEEAVESVVRKLHERTELVLYHPAEVVLERLSRRWEIPVVREILARLEGAGRLRRSARGWGLAGYGPQLSQHESRVLAQLIEAHRRAGFQPPTLSELSQQVTGLRAAVPRLLALGEAAGELVAVSDQFYLDAEWEQRLCQAVREELRGGRGITVGELRELLGVTRKHAVPLAEYLDRIGVTRRSGDVRYLVASGLGSA